MIFLTVRASYDHIYTLTRITTIQLSDWVLRGTYELVEVYYKLVEVYRKLLKFSTKLC